MLCIPWWLVVVLLLLHGLVCAVLGLVAWRMRVLVRHGDALTPRGHGRAP